MKKEVEKRLDQLLYAIDDIYDMKTTTLKTKWKSNEQWIKVYEDRDNKYYDSVYHDDIDDINNIR